MRKHLFKFWLIAVIIQFLLIVNVPTSKAGGIINRIPRAFTAAATPTGDGYTEVNATAFSPTGTVDQFNDYDLYTNQSIPKGAVVEILVANSDATVEYYGGVCSDGQSALARKIQLAKKDGSTAGQLQCVRMITTCHSSTGKIEIYAENNTAISFEILGYWEGITFTERFDLITGITSGTDNMFTDVNLNTLFSTPVSRVYDIANGTFAAVKYYSGVRANGSSLDRRIDMGQAVGGGGNVTNWTVKADASGIIEVWLGNYLNCKAYSLGYFDATVDYQEAFDLVTPGNDDTWTSTDMTAYVTSPLQIEILFDVDYDGGYVGGRGGDSASTTRKVELSGLPAAGQHYSTTFNSIPDTDDVIYLYGLDVSDCQFYHIGYFK